MPVPMSKDEEIVISGISGRFPESANIEEFQENLFNGVDMVGDTSRRWPPGMYGLPNRMGTIKNLEHFDSTFFGVNAKQAVKMCPQMRILLELTYESLIDAGINPAEIRGTNTGVYIGISTSESKEFWNTDPETTHGYGLLGCSLAMMANRLSYTFDLTGPSYPLDTACASGMYALDQAVAAMKHGYCDAAIVGGTNLLLKPQNSLQFHTINMLSPEGKCKSFDESGNGYVRSEAVVVLYLQKSKDARRIYATVMGSKINNDGYKDLGITFPNSQAQFNLVRELYEEMGIKSSQVDYMEAHGTGTRAGDPQELNPQFVNAFCENRKGPLLIGSVKSNMGHSEAASGLCAIAKVLIGMETGVIPQNLHFKSPNPDIPALLDGRIKVVSKNQPWNGGYVGINCFGFGGTNSHILLRSNQKSRAIKSDTVIPRLFTVSGRTEEAVNLFLNKLQPHSNDDELMGLIHEIHKQNINGHDYRGYLLAGGQTVREVSEVTGEKRPVWFVYAGMGTQWSKIGRDMMKFEIFRNSIEKCSKALQPYGIDLKAVLTEYDDSSFDIALNSFLAITSTQIALTDILLSLGIQPDGIVGHSLGEIGCAYADGSLTAEQTILTSYFRGTAIKETSTPAGAMASVGLSWEECAKRCPSGVFPACHNSADNVTVSGPPDAVKKFVEQLTAENIFARHVNSAGKAYHSKYISAAGPNYLKSLQSLITNAKPRNSRWISSSVPESEWSSPRAQFSSAEYHLNNLLSPVLFHEAVKHIPENAILIEIGPNALFQSILKRSVGPSATVVPLMKKGHENNLEFLTSNIAKLFNAGINPKLSKLYKPVSYPVGRGTPMLQSMVGWDHSSEWTVPSFAGKGTKSGEMLISVDLSSENDSYVSGHNIDGRVLFPATGYLSLVWKAFAKLHNEDYENLPVIFEDIHIYRATIIPKTGAVKFLVNIFEGSGEFELAEGGSVCVTGRISIPEDISKETMDLPKPIIKQEKDVLNLNTTDIYKEFRLRGYTYSGIFRGIHESDNRGQSGLLKWENNWVSFTDTMLQFSVVGMRSRDMYLPIGFQKIIIDPRTFKSSVETLQEKQLPLHIPVHMYRDLGIVKTNGIEIHGMKAIIAPRRQQSQPLPKHERYLFVPYENFNALAEDTEDARRQSLKVIVQTIIENSSTLVKIKIAEFAEDKTASELLATTLSNIIEAEPEFVEQYTIVAAETTEELKSEFEPLDMKITNKLTEQNHHLLVVHNLFTQNKLGDLENLLSYLRDGGMILSQEDTEVVNMAVLKESKLELVSRHVVGLKTYLLLRRPVDISKDSIVIKITENNFKWVEPLAEAMKQAETEGTKVYIVVENEETNGIMGLATCIMREAGGFNIRVVFIQDSKSEKFSLTTPFYVKQLKKDLMFNVLKNGEWGTFRHIVLDNSKDSLTRPAEHAYINALTKGDLSSFRWIESPLKNYRQDNKNAELCSVYYAGLNVQDALLASGKLPPDAITDNILNQDCPLGLEFSGRDTQGRRVMGLVNGSSIATTVLADRGLLWEIPKNWSLEEASTVPVAYATAYYALILRGRMRPEESVLIHAGAGEIGLAAINIALHMGCTVFTTVDSQSKRDFLKKQYPQLSDSNIGNSDDTSFEHLVLQQTNGRGVDLVLNSLAEEKLEASIRCLKKNGRFLEIGKLNYSNNNRIEMRVFLKNVTFHGIFLDVLTDPNNYERQEVSKLISEGIKNGVISPLPSTVFPDDEVEQAFRYLSNSKNIGKVTIKIRDEESSNILKPTPKVVSALPRTYFSPDKSYIIVGGLGAMGLELANWFISRGATKLVLVSRDSIKKGYQSLCIRNWREMGKTIIVSTTDVTTESGTKRLLEEAQKLGPIGGIFNVAAVINDATMVDQTEEHFKFTLQPKLVATKNLDKISRVMCPDLEYFVAWSSFSCGRGNEGQSNYGYANSALERLCEARKEAGLPTLIVQTSGIGDVGLTFELIRANDNIIRGTHPQAMPSTLQTIDKFLQNKKYPILCTMVVAEKKRSNASSGSISPAEAVASILGIKDVKRAPLNTSFSDLGMDSLMGDEVKQTLERNYDIVLKPQEIRALTFEKLNKLSSEGTS